MDLRAHHRQCYGDAAGGVDGERAASCARSRTPGGGAGITGLFCRRAHRAGPGNGARCRVCAVDRGRPGTPRRGTGARCRKSSALAASLAPALARLLGTLRTDISHHGPRVWQPGVDRANCQLARGADGRRPAAVCFGERAGRVAPPTVVARTAGAPGAVAAAHARHDAFALAAPVARPHRGRACAVAHACRGIAVALARSSQGHAPDLAGHRRHGGHDGWPRLAAPRPRRDDSVDVAGRRSRRRHAPGVRRRLAHADRRRWRGGRWRTRRQAGRTTVAPAARHHPAGPHGAHARPSRSRERPAGGRPTPRCGRVLVEWTADRRGRTPRAARDPARAGRALARLCQSPTWTAAVSVWKCPVACAVAQSATGALPGGTGLERWFAGAGSGHRQQPRFADR